MSSTENSVYPSETVQKILVLAVARAEGGLANVDLEALCDKNPTVFGERSTIERRGVQFKVRDWKQKPHTFEADLRRAGGSSLLLPTVDEQHHTRSTRPIGPGTMLSSKVKTRSQSKSPIRSPPMLSPPKRSQSMSPLRSPKLDVEVLTEAPKSIYGTSHFADIRESMFDTVLSNRYIQLTLPLSCIHS